MKHSQWKTALILILISGLGFAAGTGTKISAGSSDYAAKLGDGYDLKQEALKGNCLIGTPEAHGIATSTANFEQTISYDELEKDLGFGAAGRAKFGIVSTSASAKFLSQAKSDSYSISAIYSANYRFKNLMLTRPTASPEVVNHLENDERWEEACGHEYVSQITLGAKLYFAIRIDFTSDMEKKAFEAAFSVEAPLWGVSGQVSTAAKSLSKRTKVTITTLQVGGDVGKISHIYGTDDNLVQCSIGQFEKCSAVLTAALDYARTDFPKQLDQAELVANPEKGPVAIDYLTKPYATAGIFPKVDPITKDEVKRARTKLNDYVTNNYHHWVFARRFSQSGGRRLSSRQRALVEAAKVTMDRNMQFITDAAKECYDHPDERCITKVNELATGQPQELKVIDPTVFIIENESFAQYCDDGLSPGPYAGTDLKDSVAAYLKVAREIGGESFRPPGPNLEMDECGIAETVLRGVRSLKLSGLGIKDIRPLMPLTQLESLDLSDNEIRSLDAFGLPFVERSGGFKNLRHLNLHRNQIAEVDALKACPMLVTLDLSNNQIQNADALKTLTKLRRVDLRNNSQYLKLELPAPAIVLTADHGSSAIFVSMPRNIDVRRYGHQAVTLPDNRVLITGGIEGAPEEIGAEIFDPTRGTFGLVKGMSAPRIWHSLTLLPNGAALAIGGYRTITADIFQGGTGFQRLPGNLERPRASHTATLLPNGKVLVTGGWRFGLLSHTSLSAELYDPATGSFSPLASGLSVPRAAHTATILKDGRVLLVGGINDNGASNSADIYDPATGQLSPLGRRMQFARGFHTASLLPSGKVLIVGGIESGQSLDTAELFDPTTNSFSVVESKLRVPRMGHQATSFASGVVALTGGSRESEEIRADLSCKSCTDEVELYDPATNDFVISNQKMVRPRVFHSVTQSGPNQYLVLGGLGQGASDSAEILSYSAPNR